MGEKEICDNNSGCYRKKSDSDSENHHNNGCACKCGHNHETETDSAKEYIIIALSAVLLGVSLSGGHLGLSETVVNIFAVLSALCTGIPIIAGFVKGLFGGRQSVCELAGIAIIGAILIGEYITAAEVGLILSIGEVAEDFAYKRTRRDLEKMASFHPDYGFVEKEGAISEVPVDAIEAGDIVLIRPGDIVPSDGYIISGSTSVDESFLTGESIPVEKNISDPVYSGSVNINGVIRIKVSKKSSESAYSKIVGFVREAEARRPPTYPFIDKFASIYTPFTLVVTVLTFAFTGSIERAITILIVACPCALLLSTPSAVISAIGVGARRGILVKSGLYLEEAEKIDTVLFDKTGTLSSGKMRVKSIKAFGNFDEVLITALAAAAECGSEHPVADAIVRYAKENSIDAESCAKTNSTPGLGVEAQSCSGRVLVGNARFLAESGIFIPDYAKIEAESLSNEGMTPVFIAQNEDIAGIFGIEDSIREESAAVLADLKKIGINNISMVSGDKCEVAKSVGRYCGINQENVFSGAVPGEKKSIVKNLQSAGRKVCFVGDGVNDAPALAQANVGISIGKRENSVAIETSHVVLLKDDLSLLLSFILLGKRTVKTIKLNVFFALSLTFLLMGLAFSGLIHPAVGALGHQIAVLAVLFNSALIPVLTKKIV